MKIIVALIILALVMAPSEVDLYFKKKALKRRKEEYELYQKWLKENQGEE